MQIRRSSGCPDGVRDFASEPPKHNRSMNPNRTASSNEFSQRQPTWGIRGIRRSSSKTLQRLVMARVASALWSYTVWDRAARHALFSNPNSFRILNYGRSKAEGAPSAIVVGNLRTGTALAVLDFLRHSSAHKRECYSGASYIAYSSFARQ